MYHYHSRVTSYCVAVMKETCKNGHESEVRSDDGVCLMCANEYRYRGQKSNIVKKLRVAQEKTEEEWFDE